MMVPVRSVTHNNEYHRVKYVRNVDSFGSVRASHVEKAKFYMNWDVIQASKMDGPKQRKQTVAQYTNDELTLK